MGGESMKEMIKENPEGFIGGILLLIMVIIAFINVVSRYLLGIPLASIQEVEVNFFVWVTFLGIAIAFKERANLSVEFFRDQMSERYRKIAEFVGLSLSLALFVIFFYLSAEYTYLTNVVYNTRSPGLNLPQWIYIIGMSLISIVIIFRIVQRIKRLVLRG